MNSSRNSDQSLTIVEEQTTWLDSLLPSNLLQPLPSGISLHYNGRQYGIRASGICGTVRLRDGRTLYILPKVGDANFLRMLLGAYGDQANASTFDNDFTRYQYEDSSLTPRAMIARQLVRQADMALHRSLRIRRVRMVYNGAFAEGALDPVGTALRLMKQSSEPVVSMRATRTYNTAENRIIVAGLDVALELLPMDNLAYAKRTLTRWRTKVPEPVNLIRDLTVVQRGLARRGYRGPKGYYEELLRLATIVLGFAGIGFGRVTQVTASGMIMNTNKVFEDYVRATIMRGARFSNLVVEKPGPRDMFLYTDHSLSLQPDIVVTRYSDIVLIADAKYKAPDSSDHHQMYTYLSSLGVSTGAIIYPNQGQDTALRTRVTSSGAEIVELGLPLGDFGATEQILEQLTND